MTTTVEYAPGRQADLYGLNGPAVLLWHGSAANYRHVMAPLGQAIAAYGFGVVAPDWSKESEDRGRGDLLNSVRFARERRKKAGGDPGDLVVVAWSLGGTAALSLAVNHEQFGTNIKAAVLLAAPAHTFDPLTGVPLPEKLPETRAAIEVVHGRDDRVVDPADALDITTRLKAAGNRATLTLLGADHGTIAMAQHNVAEDSYTPWDTEETRIIGESIASIVARHAVKH